MAWLGSKSSDFKFKCSKGHRHRTREGAQQCYYCRRIEYYEELRGYPRRGMRKFRGKKWYQIPIDTHPVVTRLFIEMREQCCCYGDMADRSGVDIQTISAWRTKNNPSIVNLEACLNVLGLTLTVKKRGGQ